MKYLLMALVSRYDGSTYTQVITYLSEENKNNKQIINNAIKSFERMLGKDYYLINTWIE